MLYKYQGHRSLVEEFVGVISRMGRAIQKNRETGMSKGGTRGHTLILVPHSSHSASSLCSKFRLLPTRRKCCSIESLRLLLVRADRARAGSRNNDHTLSKNKSENLLESFTSFIVRMTGYGVWEFRVYSSNQDPRMSPSRISKHRHSSQGKKRFR